VSPRVRKAVAGAIVLVWLIAWIMGAVVGGLWVSAHAPKWVIPLFYAIVGIGWGVPLFPLFTWAEHGRWKRPRPPG
jgi:hypothetical protein